MADTEEEAPPPKKSSLIPTVAVVAVLTLVAAGGGWFLGGMLAPQTAQPEEVAGVTGADKADKKEAGKEKEEKAAGRPNILGIAPITTNLSYPSDNWIRIELALVFRDAPDEAMADKIHQDIMAYLRTVSLQQIEGPRGFKYLHDDLRERVILRSEGRVTDILFRTFVIE